MNVSNAAVWNGVGWSTPGFVSQQSVQAIAVKNGEVYVAGSTFTLPSRNIARGVIKLAGNAWSGLGTGVGNGQYLAPVLAVSIRGNEMYAGGGPFALPGERADGINSVVTPSFSGQRNGTPVAHR